ncbi:MAG TPA: hypothetical protein VFB07_11030 [Vicinamibacterales bacterium]|nr:hypothetical protein [Vicinamibacterales bacterium]
MSGTVRAGLFVAALASWCGVARAQEQADWMLMQDGIVFAEFDHQGGPRGGNEAVVPNWWMGMASRDTSAGRLTFEAMLSLDPATVGRSGYGELFQAGEALDGHPLVDRQHPHDAFMQLAAVWRVPLTDAMGLTIAGGPVGEPALGPVAFMHRASAIDNPTAPLSHHTFDSTHIAFGVVTVAADHGPFVLEGSLFNGREPDDRRWDFDFGRLDSFSARVWYRPSDEWEFQASSGRLTSPEQLEPGQNVVRTTVTGAWTRKRGFDIESVTAGFGVNETDHRARPAFFVEAARHKEKTTVYGRFEVVDQEYVANTVVALTVGGAHDVWRWRGFEGGVGGDVTFYGVPAALQPAYSAHPTSFHLFFRLRPPAGHMGRMWNMRMSQPMR